VVEFFDTVRVSWFSLGGGEFGEVTASSMTSTGLFMVASSSIEASEK
jgi:hypothetical protein